MVIQIPNCDVRLIAQPGPSPFWESILAGGLSVAICLVMGVVAANVCVDLKDWFRSRRDAKREKEVNSPNTWTHAVFNMGQALGKLEGERKTKEAHRSALTQAWEIVSTSTTTEEAASRISAEIEALQ